MMKRILYLDVLRGFLIFYVVFIHAVLLIIFQANYDYIDLLPIWLIAFLFPLLLIAMWGPLFSMMSATTNTYLVYHQLNKGKNLRGIILTRMSSYLLIILVHLINMTLFIHFIPLDGQIYRSLLCGTIETGQLTIPNMLMFLNSGTLLLIGLSGILINIILLVLWRNKKDVNLKNTAYVFIGIALLFLLIRPVMYPAIDDFILYLANQNMLIPAIGLSWLFRGQFGLIPMAAIPFFGVVFGTFLAANYDKQQMKKAGVLTTTGMGGVGILFFAFYGTPDLTLPYWPITMVTANLVIMILITTLFILRYEYTSQKKRVHYASRTRFFRRFSMITLTMFVFESIIAVLWAKLFLFIFQDPFPFNVIADILFVFCVLATWYVIARLWEKIDFKYSVEWFMVQIMAKITGRSSQKLDVKTILYNPLQGDDIKNRRSSR